MIKQEVIHQTDWPLYLSLEQREQLLASKIARAVAAARVAAPQNIAPHAAKIINPQSRNRGSKRPFTTK